VSFEVKSIEIFELQAKRLIKKYPSLALELKKLVLLLKSNPNVGIALGRDCYKIRIAIKSKGKGKSGGGRIITCVKVERNHVYCLPSSISQFRIALQIAK